MRRPPVRSFADLRESGLLWLINRVVFHPRGFALALVYDASGVAVGWRLLGKGDEVYSMVPPEDDEFRAAEITLRSAAGR